jgi:hypothetical protein
MKQSIIMLLLLSFLYSHAQPPPVVKTHEQQLENLAEREEASMEDDSFMEQLEIFRRHPINLNKAGQDELQLLQVLDAMQVNALLQYRALLGKFIHLYELQAIPHWDVATIQKILPYITINEEVTIASHIAPALQKGSATLVFRLSRSLQKAEGFTDTGSARFKGSPDKIFVRYRYNYKNLLQFGMVGDKDAGEQITWGKRRYGFDFYSFHFFARKIGVVQSLAVGDFTVNVGQGLIQWQSMAFGKGELTAIKRQSAMLRPYNSAGEFNFHRGVAVHLAKKQFQFIAFCSFRRLDGNLSLDSSGLVISSFITTGLHRSGKELAERNNIYQQVVGGAVSYDHGSWRVSSNALRYRFSNAVQKREEPYNLFSFRGDRLFMYSINYEYTFRNLHWFGEVAADHSLNKAFVNGFLLSMHRRMDLSILYRNIQPGFQPFYASAFTESSQPSNESGIFIGLGCRLFERLKLDAYADVFRFPWLKFRADAPSGGSEYQVQLTWQPRKVLELSTRFRTRKAFNNNGDTELPVHLLTPESKTNWRAQVSWQPTSAWQFTQRMEMVWYSDGEAEKEEGYLLFADARYKSATRPWSLGGRLQLFETDGFNSRIYAFEQDAPAAVIAVYHKGIRYYLNVQIDIGKGLSKRTSMRFPRIELWCRYSGSLAEMQAGTASQPKSGVYKIQLVFWWD